MGINIWQLSVLIHPQFHFEDQGTGKTLNPS